MTSIVDFSSGIFIKEKIAIEGVGDVPITLTTDHLQKRALYQEALMLHRGIKSSDQVNMADPIVLFYIVVLLLGTFDPQYQEQLEKDGYKNLSSEVAEKAISLARDYHASAASSTTNESMIVTMFDDMFELKRSPDGRVVVKVRDEYNLPAVPEGYFDDSKINDERSMEGMPPLFPRNPVVPVEQKLAYITALLTEHPALMIRVNGFFNSNLTEEVRQAMIKQEAAKVDEAGFHDAGVDNPVHEPNDAASQQSDEGNTGTSD